MTEQLQRHFAGFQDGGLAGQDRATILAIGSPPVWDETLGGQAAQVGVSYIELEDLNATMISLLVPGLVLSPVVAKTFDCLDVASVLQDSGFTGAYRAVTQRLPNPSIVRREVRALFPEIDFDILVAGKASFYAS